MIPLWKTVLPPLMCIEQLYCTLQTLFWNFYLILIAIARNHTEKDMLDLIAHILLVFNSDTRSDINFVVSSISAKIPYIFCLKRRFVVNHDLLLAKIRYKSSYGIWFHIFKSLWAKASIRVCVNRVFPTVINYRDVMQMYFLFDLFIEEFL